MRFTKKMFSSFGEILIAAYWNEYRKKWIMIGVQSFGNPSILGEFWFSESDKSTDSAVFIRESFSDPDHCNGI